MREMKLLCEGGFLSMEEDKNLCLTDAGREAAEQVYEKHCTLKEMLVSLGVCAETAESDACRMEHVVSEETLDRIKSFLAKE